MSEVRKTTIVDESTGEVISSKVKKLTLFDEEKGYLFWKSKHGVKFFPDIKLPDDINDADELRLIRLARHMLGSTNMLAYRGYMNTVKPLTLKHMESILNMAERSCADYIRKMIKLGIMARVTVHCENEKETQYYLNPLYFFSGNRIPLNLYLLFRHQLDRFLPDWVKEKYAEQEKIMKNTKLRRRK